MDHDSETTEGGAWEQLSAAHSKIFVLGHCRNKHATVPFGFPAAAQITGLGPISDTLTGPKRWNYPGIIELLDRIMSDPKKLQSFISK